MCEGAANAADRPRRSVFSAYFFFLLAALSASVLVLVLDLPLALVVIAALTLSLFCFLNNERPVAVSLSLTALLLPASTVNDTVPMVTVVAFFLPLTVFVTLTFRTTLPTQRAPPAGQLTVSATLPLASTLEPETPELGIVGVVGTVPPPDGGMGVVLGVGVGFGVALAGAAPATVTVCAKASLATSSLEVTTSLTVRDTAAVPPLANACVTVGVVASCVAPSPNSQW